MSVEEFLIDAYKNMDAMKGQIKARYAELNGREPRTQELQQQCWDVWRLTTFYLDALEYMDRDHEEPEHTDHAPYVPPEFAGERSERIQAMDARLHEVLGDTVEVVDEDEEEADDTSFDFEPSADEQITMIEYGAIIYEWSDFVENMNLVRLGEGDRYVMMNIVQHYFGGFDDLMVMLYDCLMERLRTAQ
jgi:hypothetical protein